MSNPIHFIKTWASVDGWRVAFYQKQNKLLQFRKGNLQANLYLGKMTLVVQGKKLRKTWKRMTEMEVADALHDPFNYEQPLMDWGTFINRVSTNTPNRG